MGARARRRVRACFEVGFGGGSVVEERRNAPFGGPQLSAIISNANSLLGKSAKIEAIHAAALTRRPGQPSTSAKVVFSPPPRRRPHDGDLRGPAPLRPAQAARAQALRQGARQVRTPIEKNTRTPPPAPQVRAAARLPRLLRDGLLRHPRPRRRLRRPRRGADCPARGAPQARATPCTRPALASRVTWPRRLPQVTDGMYGQLAYGMATAVYQVRSSRPLAGAAPAPHSPSYPWRRCR